MFPCEGRRYGFNGWCVLILVLFLTLAGGLTVVGRGDASAAVSEDGLGRQARPPVSAAQREPAQTIGDHVLYLPAVRLDYPSPPTLFGAEIARQSVGKLPTQAVEAHVTWLRYGAVNWDEIEAVQGVRDWSKLRLVEQDLAALSAAGLTTSVVVLGAPAWAQQEPGAVCGPIRRDALDDFADFMGELVRRLGAPPYNVKYWELGNEPDVEYEPAKEDQRYGCWGDSADPYYGGEYYAEMLKQVYPAVKSSDPSARVMNGGLLLDCNPNDPPIFGGKPLNCLPGRFFEGMLRNGAADYLDIVAYHAYALYFPGADWDLEDLRWSQGTPKGLLAGKTAYLRSIMQKYNADLPLLMNESGLLCHEYQASQNLCPAAALSNPTDNPQFDAFFDAQANFVIRLYSRVGDQKILGALWFTLDGPGWRQGGLLNSDGTPRPAYRAYQNLAGLLRGKSYAGRLATGDLEGHSFAGRNQAVYVYWSNSPGVQHTVTLPANLVSVRDKFGQEISYSGATISVGFDPIILILNR